MVYISEIFWEHSLLKQCSRICFIQGFNASKEFCIFVIIFDISGSSFLILYFKKKKKKKSNIETLAQLIFSIERLRCLDKFCIILKILFDVINCYLFLSDLFQRQGDILMICTSVFCDSHYEHKFHFHKTLRAFVVYIQLHLPCVYRHFVVYIQFYLPCVHRHFVV